MKATTTAPIHRSFFDQYAWMKTPLFWLGLLAQTVSFLTEFAPIKFAVHDSMKFFIGESIANAVSFTAALMGAFIIEGMVRYGFTMVTRGVLHKHYKGLPIKDEQAENPDPEAEALAGKMARFLFYLFCIIAGAGVGLSVVASYSGSIMAGEKFITLPEPDSIDNRADSAAIIAALTAFRADSAAIMEAGTSTERALKRQAAATESPAIAASFRAQAAQAKADAQNAVVTRSQAFRAETKEAADRITKRISDRDQAHAAAVAATKAEGARQGKGLAWLTIFFQILSVFSLVFLESLKKGSGQKDVLNISAYAFHGGLFSEAKEALAERFNQVAREKIANFRAETKNPVIFTPGDIVDATGIAAGAKIVKALPSQEPKENTYSIAAKADEHEQVSQEEPRRQIGFFANGMRPEGYAKGTPGNLDASSMKEVKTKPDQKPGFYVLYEHGVKHVPDLPSDVYGSYPEESPNFGQLKRYQGKTCKNCGVAFEPKPVWRLHCTDVCRTEFNNRTRGLRARK